MVSKFDNSDPLMMHQVRPLIADLMARRAWIYWLDFGITIGLSWTLVAIYFTATPWSIPQLAALVFAAIGFFRAGTFIHEIVHFKAGEMRSFKWAWNLLLGFPMLSPWVIYRNHIEHHTRQHFGTPGDGEYLPLASAPPAETLKYLAQIPLLPPLAVIRFGILGPLSHLSPKLREWLLTRGSAAITNPYYRKRFPAGLEPELERSEWFCFGWILLLTGITIFGPIEPVHWLMAWALLALALGLNWVRNLAAHGYAHDGTPMDKTRQIADSINITGQTWLPMWLFPVGLRYHALHHLLPGLPYHQLGRAHKRLIRALPVDHPYHGSNRGSYFQVISELLRGAWHSRHRRDVIARWQLTAFGMRGLPLHAPADAGTGASSGLAALINPLSFQMSLRQRSKRCGESVRARGGEVFTVRDLRQIEQALAQTQSRGNQRLVIAGGDGTLQGVVTWLARHTAAAAMPQLLLLSAGRTNYVAGDIGTRSRIIKTLDTVLSTTPDRLHPVDRPTLKLEHPSIGEQHGFFLAGAMIDEVIRYVHRFQNRGDSWLRRHHISSQAGLASLALHRALGRYRFNLPRLDIDAEGLGHDRAAFRFLMMTTLAHQHNLIEPYASRGTGPLRVTAIRKNAKRLAWRLPKLARGRYSTKMNSTNGYISGFCNTIVIQNISSFVLDGQEFELDPSTPLRVSAGPVFRFLRP